MSVINQIIADEELTAGRITAEEFVSSLLKEDVPMPEITYSDSLIDQWSSGQAAAMYHSDDKAIILPEGVKTEGLDYKISKADYSGELTTTEALSHELLHYLDDLDVTDVVGKTLARTDKEDPRISASLRKDMTIFGLGEKKEHELGSYYTTPMWGYDVSRNLSTPMEHLTYYSEPRRGDIPNIVMEGAAKRIVDEYRPEKINYNIIPGFFPWSEPDTVGMGIVPEREPEMNIQDLVKFVEDRNATLDIYDELKNKYMTEEADQYYYQR